MSKMSMQKFAVFGKIRNLWECQTGWNRIPDTEELYEERKYQNEKEDILRIILNDERNVVLPIRKRELHRIDAFGDTGLYMGKCTYNAKLRSGKQQIPRNNRRIITDRKEAA